MSSWFRSISCQRYTLSRFYATDITSASRRKWRLAGVPQPRSILEDDNASVDLTEDNEIVNGTRPNTPPPHLRHPPDKPTPYEYREHQKVMKKNFPGGWSPPRKLSREAMEGVRQLHRFDPEKFDTPVLAEKFKISPEAVRRILKSKWEPPREKRLKLAEKEREERSGFIKLNRVKERVEARQLEKLKKVPKSDQKSGGVSIHDTFTFK